MRDARRNKKPSHDVAHPFEHFRKAAIMNRKSYFSLLAFALTLLAAMAFVVGRNSGASAASSSAALFALPSSDFVIHIDTRRALGETLPSLLSGNTALLARMNSHLEKFERETGINPRVFESVAIGGKIGSAKSRDSRTVVIARGSFNSDQLLETAFASAKAKGEKIQKEEQVYEGKRIILISSNRKSRAGAEVSEDADTAKSNVAPRNDRMVLAVIDSNTLAAGDLQGVRAAIDASLGRERVDEELVRLATQTPGAVVGFSGRLPQGFAAKASPNNTIEKYFASIRQFYGSFSVNGTDMDSLVAVRTETPEQAAEIGQALNTIKTLSAFGFSRSSGGDGAKANSLADLFKGLTITTQGNEIQINVRIPQGSVAPLLHTF
jgi:hypothetical protein